MKITAAIVGSKIRPYKTTVNWRSTTNYAAAVHDLNPMYIDDTKQEGIIAPPMFAVALSWPVIENIRNYAEIPIAQEIYNTMVHYTEYLEFKRPIRPGDTVVLNGEVVAVKPVKAGVHLVFRFIATDPQGLEYHTEYIGGLFRGVGLEGNGRGDMPDYWKPKYESSEPLWTVSINIDPSDPYIYDGCTNIVFAIHTSPSFAQKVGLPGIIYQGTATMAQCVRELVNHEVNGNALRLAAVGAQFTGMVFPGTTIDLMVMERRNTAAGCEVAFQVVNQEGTKVLSNGYVRFS